LRTAPVRRAARMDGSARPVRIATMARPNSSSKRVMPRLPFRRCMCGFCCRVRFPPRLITAAFALFRIAGVASARILPPMPLPDLDPLVVENLNQRLTSAGVRPTAQRLRIAALLLGRPQHLSADQVLAGLRGQGLRVSKATIYNTLNLFAASGLIRQLSV